MSLPALDQLLPTDSLRIVAWPDPVIDLVGHDLRSSYVERFWLPILGPSTTLLLRLIAAGLDESPDGFDLPLIDTACALGLGTRGGRNAPFLRAIERSSTFKLTRSPATGVLEVRRKVPPLTRVQISRLPASLQDAHSGWLEVELRTPDLETKRRKARRLALSLAELGDDDEAIERQLHLWKVHPAMAHDALRWARQRHQPDTDPNTTATTPPAEADRRPIPPPPARPHTVFTPAGDAA